MSDNMNKLVMPEMGKIATPRGEAASMRPLSPSDMRDGYAQSPAPPSEAFSNGGADWMGPLTPMQPIAPPEVAGRSLDFVPGFNLNTEPRQFEPISFHTLRALAESYDPVRLIIERRKDQMCRLPWTIRLKHEDHGKRPTNVQLSAPMRDRIREVTKFFKKPNFELNFSSWLRFLIEDLLVIDAPSIYLERDQRGNLLALQPIDGALVKRVIDDWGRTPRPIAWNGAPFDWNGQLITRENFVEQGFKARNGYAWPPIAQQILKGLPAANLTALDLIYRPMNLRPGRTYGFSPVEQVMMTVSIAMRRQVAQLDYFKEGNQPEALYALPASWAPDQIQRFQDYWDSLHTGNWAMRRKMKFVAGDNKSAYTQLKEPPLKNDFDEWLVRIVCFAFSYPPAPFVALSNRSTAEQHERTAEEEGLEPLKQWACETFNEIIEHHLDEDELEFAFVEEDEVDQQKQAVILNSYVANGVLSINEVREKLGEDPDADPAACRLMVKTATGYVPIGERPKGDRLQDGAETMPTGSNGGEQ